MNGLRCIGRVGIRGEGGKAREDDSPESHAGSILAPGIKVRSGTSRESGRRRELRSGRQVFLDRVADILQCLLLGLALRCAARQAGYPDAEALVSSLE